MKLKKILLFILPSTIFIIPGLLGLTLEIYNRYYRGVPTPYLMPSLGFILLSCFFLVRKHWMYLVLGILTLMYLALCLRLGLWESFNRSSLVYYYKTWSLDTKTGRIHLEHPVGRVPPNSGAYISCNFNLSTWQSYLDNQPILCSAFDDQLRLLMYLNDNDTDQGILREFQFNQFRVDRKSVLGEPLDRSAIRIAFTSKSQGPWPKFRIKAIYQVFEREVAPGQTRVIESFARDAKGKLKSFTESSLLNLTPKDFYAVYNEQGILSEIPRLGKESFAFPAKVDVTRFLAFELPKMVKPGDSL